MTLGPVGILEGKRQLETPLGRCDGIDPQRPKRVTIVGGGFSGAVFAHHLMRETPMPVIIDLAEERPLLGAGVAYSASGLHQTTNVTAQRMSVDAGDPTHFARWLSVRENSSEGAVEPYPNRSTFGVYMNELVRGTKPSHSDSKLRHRPVQVARVSRSGTDLTVYAVSGATWPADAVALATGNPAPLPPSPLAALAADPRVILDPWRSDALAEVRPDARVLAIGMSLTMGEAVAGLRAAGHRGEVVAIARRGRRSECGLIETVPPFGDFIGSRPKTTVGLLRHFRSEVRRAEAAGLSWRSVQTAAREQGWALWSNLSAVERRRLARHVRPFWETLRHVTPGPVHDLLATEERAGRLRLCAASLRDLTAKPDGLHATLHRRGAAFDDVLRERFDLVLNCTGPAYSTLTNADPFWSDLARAGLVRPDAIHLGIEVDQHARALDRDGTAQPNLLVLGTLARGTFGELTGVPELSRLALLAARDLVAYWQTEQSAIANIGPAVGRKAAHTG